MLKCQYPSATSRHRLCGLKAVYSVKGESLMVCAQCAQHFPVKKLEKIIPKTY
jgi:hypothetical protein